MLLLRHVTRTRARLPKLPILDCTLSITTTSSPPSFLASAQHAFVDPTTKLNPLDTRDLVLSLRGWFISSKNSLFDRIFEILSSNHGEDDRSSTDSALSQLGLRVTEGLVLDVLRYGRRRETGVLPCLKFFDWAGRQYGFYHTPATFNAIFKILSTARLMSLMEDFLESFMRHRYTQKVGFYATLVMGYAVAGKPKVALQLFGRMRFQGLDLDSLSYHVLLNALVEESCFDAVQVVAKQIAMRGLESDVTHSIMMKCLCKRKLLGEAEEFLHGLLREGKAFSVHLVGAYVEALCKNNEFERAAKLVEEIGELGVVPMDGVYDFWLRVLLRAGKMDGALEFFRHQKYLEGYIPHVFRYNKLLCKLLWQNRLEDAFDILMDMKENHVLPDKVTLSAALSFFCKAGMVDVALELYECRAEFGLSPNSMAYNYLINTLCGDGSTDGAYRVLKDSMDQGCFPGKRTFDVLADGLCSEGKLDKMKELLVAALERNFMPSVYTYDKFISVLCRARRVEEGYLLHGELNRANRFARVSTYLNLIRGFNKSNRGDIAARLLVEMQEKGYFVSTQLFREVICCLCNMEDSENQFQRLLEIQLSRHESNSEVFNCFIDAAGHARRPELARRVYEMMSRNGIQLTVSSDILMLRSYLKNDRIADALNFFGSLFQKRVVSTKLYNALLVGLCRRERSDIAWHYLRHMRGNGLVPSVECYELLVQLLCAEGKYDRAVCVISDLKKVGRGITSFIGNVLLLHCMKSPRPYEAWVRAHDGHDQKPETLAFGELLRAFTTGTLIKEDAEDWEELISRCYVPDLYTYNLILRKLGMNGADGAIEFFNKICEKGFEPNMWTYDAVSQSLLNSGRTAEAKMWVEEMLQN